MASDYQWAMLIIISCGVFFTIGFLVGFLLWGLAS